MEVGGEVFGTLFVLLPWGVHEDDVEFTQFGEVELLEVLFHVDGGVVLLPDQGGLLLDQGVDFGVLQETGLGVGILDGVLWALARGHEHHAVAVLLQRQLLCEEGLFLHLYLINSV